MSLPTWAKMPVVGATYPMRSSSAAFAGAVRPKATTPPNNGEPSRRSKVIVIAYSLVVVTFPARVRRSQVPFFHVFSISSRRPSLPESLRDAHQPRWQVQDRQHVDGAQRVLPPGNQRAEVFAQAEHDERADNSADQRTRAAENRHQQRVDRGGQHH